VTLSIVIATRNRGSLLGDALASVAAQDPPPTDLELLVVDDASTDETATVAQKFAAGARFPVHLVTNEGKAQNAGRNTGVRHGRGDVVLFIDDDEELPTDFVRTLRALLEAHPEAGAFGGPYLEKAGRQPRTCRRCSLSAALVLPNATGEYESLLGGNMAIRRGALELVGEFDPTLSGGNETEWFHRARSRGLRIVYDDRLSVWHRRDYESLRSLMRKAFREGRRYHLYLERTGQPVRPHPISAIRHAGHAMFRRCSKGAFLAARELGRTLSAVTVHFSKRRRSAPREQAES
jgi:glycosyltransferase involved in cell wall biosynthesis